MQASFFECRSYQGACVWITQRHPSCLRTSQNICVLTKDYRAGCGSVCTHDRLQVLIASTVVWRSPARLLRLMTALSAQLSSSQSSFTALLMLSKLQQCEVDGSNYKVFCVMVLVLSLSLLGLMLLSTVLWFKSLWTGNKQTESVCLIKKNL